MLQWGWPILNWGLGYLSKFCLGGMERSTMTDTGGTVTVSIYPGLSVLAEYDNGAAPGPPSTEYIYNGAGDTTSLLAIF